MRRLLVESARRRQSLKRGGGGHRVELEPVDSLVLDESLDLIALDEALEKLAQEDALKAELVKLRFFAGQTMPETARLLGLSLTTAERHWTVARTWLFMALEGEPTKSSTKHPGT
jgi:RNA polymerase sigma factor (TIGR02999 family)